MKFFSRLWLARLLIGLVTAWNLQVGLVFFFWPAAYAPRFELTGVPGIAAIQGVGLLFLMWNVPYLLALWQPQRNGLALKAAFAMQTLGLFGELLIRAGLPTGHELLADSLMRFILFDGSGLVGLALAWWLTRPSPPKPAGGRASGSPPVGSPKPRSQ